MSSKITNKAQQIINESFLREPLWKLTSELNLEKSSYNLFMCFEYLDLYTEEMYCVYSLDEYKGKTLLSNVVYSERTLSNIFDMAKYKDKIAWRMDFKDYRCANFLFNIIKTISKLTNDEPFNLFVDSNMKIINDLILKGMSEETIKTLDSYKKTLYIQLYNFVIYNDICLRHKEYKPETITFEEVETEKLINNSDIIDAFEALENLVSK